ncbi:MAG: hypothetical protein ACRDTS_01220 [Mycobacterium sp.]
MPAVEEELREAISYRNEMAVELANGLLFLAGHAEPWLSLLEGGIISGRYHKIVTDIEALTAVILQRAGMPWDAMAARADISKQALHRRLGSRGEALFAESLRESDWRTTDPRALKRSLRKAERANDYLEQMHAVHSLPVRSADLVWHLARRTEPDDILTAPTKFAARLSELRTIPRWWWSGG